MSRALATVIFAAITACAAPLPPVGPACTPVGGDDCAADEVCAHRDDMDEGNTGHCLPSCPATPGLCSDGSICLRDSSNAWSCWPGRALHFGQVCDSVASCEHGLVCGIAGAGQPDTQGSCRVACGTRDDCPPGQECQIFGGPNPWFGNCVPPCTADTDCPAGRLCIDRFCTY